MATSKKTKKLKTLGTWSTGTRRANRTQTTAILVRLQAEEMKVIKEAARIRERELQGTIPGAKVPVYSFVLAAALEKAREMVGKSGRK